jgi:hypothetical protein
MKDFMEVEHGFACLQSAYQSEEGKHLRVILDRMFDGQADEVTAFQNSFSQIVSTFRRTKIFSFLKAGNP